MDKTEKIASIILCIVGVVIVVDGILAQFFNRGVLQYNLVMGYSVGFVLLTTKYKNLLKKDYTKKDINHLSKKFSDLVLKKVIDSKKVHGVYDFLENNYKNFLFFISTGTPNEEINKIIRKTNMKKFFRLCLGSPKKKEDHISLILKDFLLKKEQLLFVGDSLTDVEAAKKFNIDFILRLHSGNKILAEERNLRVIKDFNDLEILLKTNYS